MHSPAAYLRCYPYDPRNMAARREAVRRFANRLGLRPPLIYLDNGCTSADPRPQLDELASSIAAGLHQVLLVPSPWVFSIDDLRARRTMQMLTLAGCRRILCLPRASWCGATPNF